MRHNGHTDIHFSCNNSVGMKDASQASTDGTFKWNLKWVRSTYALYNWEKTWQNISDHGVKRKAWV